MVILSVSKSKNIQRYASFIQKFCKESNNHSQKVANWPTECEQMKETKTCSKIEVMRKSKALYLNQYCVYHDTFVPKYWENENKCNLEYILLNCIFYSGQGISKFYLMFAL